MASWLLSGLFLKTSLYLTLPRVKIAISMNAKTLSYLLAGGFHMSAKRSSHPCSEDLLNAPCALGNLFSLSWTSLMGSIGVPGRKARASPPSRAPSDFLYFDNLFELIEEGKEEAMRKITSYYPERKTNVDNYMMKECLVPYLHFIRDKKSLFCLLHPWRSA